MQGSHKKCNLYSRRATSGWQYTSLILVDHEVNINEAYYCNVMLLQQFLLATRQISIKFFVFQQGSAPARAHTAFFRVTLPDIKRF